MAIDQNTFVATVVGDLQKIKGDLETFRNLSATERKEILTKIFNKLIDLPMMPEFVEAMLFGWVITWVESMVKDQLLTKK